MATQPKLGDDADDDVFRVGNLFVSRQALQSVRDSLVPLEKRSEMVSAKVTTPSVSSQGKKLRQTSFQITTMVSQARHRELVHEFKTQAQDKRNLQQTLQAMSPYVVVASEPDRALQQAALNRIMSTRRRTTSTTHSPGTSSHQPHQDSAPTNQTHVQHHSEPDVVAHTSYSDEDMHEDTGTIDLERVSTLCPPDADIDSQKLRASRRRKALRAALTVQVGAPQMFSLLRAGLDQVGTSQMSSLDSRHGLGGSSTASSSTSALGGAGSAVTGNIGLHQTDRRSGRSLYSLDPRSYKREIVLCICPRVGNFRNDSEAITLELAQATLSGTPGLVAIKEVVWLPHLRRAYVVCDWDCVAGHALAGAGGIWAGLGGTGASATISGSGCDEAAAAVRSFIAQSAATAHSPFVRIGTTFEGTDQSTGAERLFDHQRRTLYWFRNCTVQPSSKQQMGRAVVAEERIRVTREHIREVNCSADTPYPEVRSSHAIASTRDVSKKRRGGKNGSDSKTGLTLVLQD